MNVVDLFCGMGGLSLGFKSEGFSVHGYDNDDGAIAAYRANVGQATLLDLSGDPPPGPADCVVGGPPCRPWTPINLRRRRGEHRDYELVRAFDKTVLARNPAVFVLENVPLLRTDATYRSLIDALKESYSVDAHVVSYVDWGAASRRRRLFAIGIQKEHGVAASTVFKLLDEARVPGQTVREAIERYADQPMGSVADHEWAQLKSIANYADKYATGQFGWYQLSWDEPAPSFGHVAKTYTLHPGTGGDVRVLSVREVIALLGFDDSYVFPASVARTTKYRMAADAVSPRFSGALARAIKEALGWA